MRHLLFLAVSLVLPLAMSAQAVPPPADSALAGITARGRQLAAYDQVSASATDALLATWPNPTGIEGFWAQQLNGGAWRVIFARLNAAGDSLVVAATVDQVGSTDSFTVERRERQGTETERLAFRALRSASRDFQAEPRAYNGPYNTAVLPDPRGGWWVYFLPGQTQVAVVPHGGDLRYAVAADGITIRDKLIMHKSVLNLAVPAAAEAGMHTVITADLPHDSDVFLVLSRRPRKPEVVVTEHFRFEIGVDGSIKWSAVKG